MSRSYKQPWVKDYQPELKKIHSRRYRRYSKRNLKHRCFLDLAGHCDTCECLDEFWDNDAAACYWRACLAYETELSYDPRNKWLPKYSICDYRFYCEGVKSRRK